MKSVIILILIISLNSFSQDTPLSIDTTETKTGARIVGWVFLGLSASFIVMGVVGIGETKSDSDVFAVREFYPACFALAGGFSVVSGVLLTIGYKRKRELERLKEDRNVLNVSIVISFGGG